MHQTVIIEHVVLLRIVMTKILKRIVILHPLKAGARWITVIVVSSNRLNVTLMERTLKG